ncbi:XRE family transcriptional regulator (plasmid) [Vibrio cyclitrophicus]
MMNTVGKKIEKLRNNAKLTKEALAKKIRVSPGAISKWELEISKPKAESAQKLAEYFKVTLSSLMTDGSNLKTQPQMVSIPYFKYISAAAGSGDIPFLEEAEELFIQESLIKKPHDTIAVKVSGDSMEPSYTNGSIVFVDRTITEISDGSVYVFVHDGMVRLKELENTPKGLKLKSHNSRYKTEEIECEYSNVKVIGEACGKLQMSC